MNTEGKRDGNKTDWNRKEIKKEKTNKPLYSSNFFLFFLFLCLPQRVG
jgi:hypothetical protein